MSRHRYCNLVVLLLCISLVPAFSQDNTPTVSGAPTGAPASNSDDGGESDEPPPPSPAAAAPKDEPARALEGMHVGCVAWDRTQYGNFLYYVPSAEPPAGLLVLVHGKFDNDSLDGTESAKWYIEAFVQAAYTRNLAIIAPCFDDTNYGTRSKAHYGGYRCLDGRVVGADRFLEGCVDRMVATIPQLTGKFLICGESSGGQFVSRYIVKHPDRIQGAVISRSQVFAFPCPEVRWPDGMGRLQTMTRWENTGPYTQVDYTPDPKGWIKVAQLPLTVVAGALDNTLLKPIEGQLGRNVVERAQNYVQAMNEYAGKQGVEGKVRLVLVNNVKDTTLDLIPACIVALLTQEPQ